MGEAKNRKQTDSNFGKVPKESRFRGIVISPQMTIDGTKLSITTGIDPELIRIWIMFWDKLVWPSSRSIFLGGTPDIDFLSEAGVLARPEYTFYGDIAQGMLKTHIQAFTDLESSAPGCWSMAQDEKSLTVLGGSNANSRDLLVRLHYAIPVPAGDVPFAEILEFKQRRTPELHRFRHEVESLYLSIDSNPDKSLALRNGAEKIQRACLDLIKVNKEWKYDSLISSLDFSVAPASLFSAGATFLASTQTLGLDTLTSTLSSAIASAITFAPGVGRRIVENKKNPYRYAALAHKELRF